MLGSITSTVLYTADNANQSKKWRVVDDVVMGGRSNGNMTIKEGIAILDKQLKMT